MLKSPRTPAISIIVPVYNAAPLLRRGLDSICRQSMKDFEVLLINDGSTDSSREILLSYCRQDPRFRLIDQENGGVSAARNTGLRAARGEFIAFMDSDDFLAPFYLQQLYRAATELDADIACCRFYRYYEEERRAVPTRLRRMHAGLYQGKRLLKELIVDLRVRFYLWDKLWRRSLFTQHGITFPNMCFEDAAVAVPLFFYAEKVAVIPYLGYYYTQRAGSMIASKSLRNMDDYIKSVALMRSFLEKQEAYPLYRLPVFVHGLTVMISNLADLTAAHKKEKDFAGLLRNAASSNAALRYYMGSHFTPANEKDILPDVLLPVKNIQK